MIILVLNSCEKDGNSPQIISLLQNKWLMVEDSVHFVAFPNGNSVYIGTPIDYYQFSRTIQCMSSSDRPMGDWVSTLPLPIPLRTILKFT